MKEFIPRRIVPDQLFFTILFAVYLSNSWCHQSIEYRRGQINYIYVDLGEAFLEIWEGHANPVLTAMRNASWAEVWRGGHITNDIV